MDHTNLPTPLTSPYPQSTHLSRDPSFCSLPENKSSLRNVSKFAILNSILKDIDGRDKSMKIIQYVIKLLLYHKVASSKRWTALATQFSITRQVLCLGNALSDIPTLEIAIRKRQILKTGLLLNAICNAISDDVYCLYRIGILPKKWGLYSEIISSHCWFISITINLQIYYLNMCQLEAQGVHGQDLQLAKVNVAKSIADLVFCGKMLSRTK